MLKIEPRFCTKPDAIDMVEWEHRDAILRNGDDIIFEQKQVEVPKNWSDTALNIAASKYLYKGPNPETSIYELVDRVCNTISRWGREANYFSVKNAKIFYNELATLMLNQMACFNSPSLFNIGLHGYGIEASPYGWRWDSSSASVVQCLDPYLYPQVSACFIQSVDDNMPDIMELAKSQAMLFKYGSGTGTNYSSLRSKRETLSGGGQASGPLSFMRISDAVAEVVRSGGKTRRAAIMRILNIDHPDILDFINAKEEVEKLARDLIAQGHDPVSVYSMLPFQNANHTVRISDKFMHILDTRGEWETNCVNSDNTFPAPPAEEIWDLIATRAHQSGDPGVQFDDTINSWNTVCERQYASNPCLSRGTRLLTSKGWVKVEDLSPTGKKTECNIFDGIKFTPGKVWKTGHKELLQLTTSSGRTLDVTPDHKIYTTEGWKKAKDCLGVILPISQPTRLLVRGNCYLPKSIMGARGKQYQQASKKVMETWGYLHGDGTLDKTRHRLSVYYTPKKDKEFLDSVVLPTLSDIAGNKGEYYIPRKRPDVSMFTFERKKLINWLRVIGVSSNSLPSRVIPPYIFQTTQKAQASFLCGLFGANGTVGKSMVSLISTCKQQLQDVQLLLQTLGIDSKIYKSREAKSFIGFTNKIWHGSNCYVLNISSQDSIYTFARTIGFPQQCQTKKLRSIINIDRKGKSSATQSLVDRVKFIEFISAEDVYDFQVNTTSMGLANGLLVHNCSEFMFIDDAACNLSSLNLRKFQKPDGTLDAKSFMAACRLMLIAQDIMVDRASYPTKKICENSHHYRPLGLGYTNFGAFLMSQGIPYDSEEGRRVCSEITSTLQASALDTSAELAKELGAYDDFEEEAGPRNMVLDKHNLSGQQLLEGTYRTRFTDATDSAKANGLRNAQLTLLAPTGTISFLMDCDTTGIEPEMALAKKKTLSGGGVINQINLSVEDGLRALGYTDAGVEKAFGYMRKGEVHKLLRDSDEKVFQTALGHNPLPWQAHIKMMAAAQPFLSGGISKTINMPSDATVEDVKAAFKMAYDLGLKSVAIYRDGSKGMQPVVVDEKKDKPQAPEVKLERKRLPDTRESITHRFTIDTHTGYFTVGLYSDGTPGELFVTMSKEGSTISGLLDSWGITFSLALQYGIPIKVLVDKFKHARFEPQGFTKNSDIRMAKSIVDYIARWLELRFLSDDILIDEFDAWEAASDEVHESLYTPLCDNCGSLTTLVGSCHICSNCGTTGGCS